jgi:hypothetical protein
LGYWVECIAAVAILQQTQPAAAQWWRDHRAELLAPGKFFIYYATCCKETLLAP